MSTTTTTTPTPIPLPIPIPTPTPARRHPSGRVHKGIRSVFSDPFDEHRSVQIDQTCFLCQREIIRHQRFRLELEAFDWQPLDRALVGIYYDGRDIDTFQQVARPLLFSRRRTDGKLALFGRRRRVIFKNIIPLESHSDCGRCHPARSIYLAHRQCFQLARSAFPDQLLRLIHFAIATRALFPPPATYPSQDLLSLHGVSQWIDADSTELGRLLAGIEQQLPTELQSTILKELKGTVVWHMLYVGVQAIPLIRKADRYNLDLEPVHVPVRSYEDNGLVTSLSAEFETIFFVDYIKDLRFNSANPCAARISIASENILGINFAVSKHGLRGLRVMYADGTASPWLGSTAGCWFGAAYGEDIQHLVMLKSVFVVLRVAFGVSNLQSENDKIINSYKVIHPLWDAPLFYPPGHTHAFRPLETGSLSIMIPYYVNWRLFNHLPLEFDDGYAAGITLYHDRIGKCAITIHGPPRRHLSKYDTIIPPEHRSLGTPSGIATHFPLAPTEYLTSVWIRESGSAGSSPVLSLGTNLGRRVNFAPHMYCIVERDAHFFTEGWSAITPVGNTAKVTSLFLHANDHTDNPPVPEPALSKELGVTLEKPLRRPSQDVITISAKATGLPRGNVERGLELPLHREASAHSIFSSHVSLKNIILVDLRRKGPRIMGLRFTYKDTTRATLGQWIPPETDSPDAQHAVIYDVAKDLPTVAFAGLDIYMQPLSPPMSATSQLMIVSHVDVARRSTVIPNGETVCEQKRREREKEEEKAVTVTGFPVSHSRGARVLKAFRNVGNMRVVWWYGFSGDEVVAGSDKREGEGVEVEIEYGDGRVVL